MAIPVADFTFSVASGTEVTFTDASTETPTAWLWEFGDGVSSTDQNPVHTYANTGIYAISLVATNADGDSEPRIIFLFIESSAPASVYTIVTMALCKLPPDYDPACLLVWQRKWQEILHVAAGVLTDYFNELNWPYLWNVLISELIVWDAIMAASQQISAGLGSTAGSSSSSSSSSTSGGVTKIKTGPSEVEFESPGDAATASSRFYGSLFGNGNLLEVYRDSICSLTRVLEVGIPSICRHRVPLSPKAKQFILKTVNNFWADCGYPISNQ